MYEVVEPDGDRRQDLTGPHAAAQFARYVLVAVPRLIKVRRRLDDVLLRVTQGHLPATARALSPPTPPPSTVAPSGHQLDGGAEVADAFSTCVDRLVRVMT